jgi:hypothetical protein
MNFARPTIKGQAGTWLLDPYNITVSSGGTQIISGGAGNYTSTQQNSLIFVSTIESALNSDTNVTITTGGSPNDGFGNGDINVISSISKTLGTGEATLTLSAYGNINFSTSASLSSTSGKLNVILNPDQTSTTGGMAVVGLSAFDLNGGTLTTSGTTSINYAPGNATFIFLKGQWNNTGTILLSENDALQIREEATLNNSGHIIITSNAITNPGISTGINIAGGTLINNISTTNGTIRKEGTGSRTISASQFLAYSPNFTQSGTLEITGGELLISGPGTDTGKYTVASSGTLTISDGTRIFQPTSIISGQGMLRVTNGSHIIKD